MRSSFVWLGLAVSTVSAGWILPESGAERQAAQKPYHHYSDASPSHTTSTISAYDISAAAQTSYIPSNRYDLADRPHSALGSMLHNLRVWLKEHSLAAPSLFSPSFHSPHALSAVTPTTTGDLHKLLLDPPADYTVSVDWSGPIFADMEGLATHTLSDGEIMARVRPMLLDATSSDGHLPGLKSGVVRVVIIRPDLIENLFYTAGHGRPEGSGLGPARNIFRVGPGMTGDAMGRRVDGQITEMLVSEERFRDIRAEAIANAAEQTKRVYANPADMPDDRRLVELNFREVWFADDDLAHPLSLPQMAEKVKFIIGDGRSQSQYLPTMKSGFIRAVYASRSMTETREFLPGYWREGGAGEQAPEYEEKKVYSEEDYERMRKGTYRPPTMDVKPYRPKVRTEGLENGS